MEKPNEPPVPEQNKNSPEPIIEPEDKIEERRDSVRDQLNGIFSDFSNIFSPPKP